MAIFALDSDERDPRAALPDVEAEQRSQKRGHSKNGVTKTGSGLSLSHRSLADSSYAFTSRLTVV